jgi:hypothetical protein
VHGRKVPILKSLDEKDFNNNTGLHDRWLFFGGPPVKKQFEICLTPTVSSEPTKFALQAEFESVTRIGKSFAPMLF